MSLCHSHSSRHQSVPWQNSLNTRPSGRSYSGHSQARGEHLGFTSFLPRMVGCTVRWSGETICMRTHGVFPGWSACSVGFRRFSSGMVFFFFVHYVFFFSLYFAFPPLLTP
ncbi:hypothetical protein BDV59DRAFT_89614 [Aspergillus ambiguus]|uniref:uncharacterized protein n=1 Tax=Aspergillus ambiguus TaxID=176160 RepID=UPI003CCCC604